MAQIVASVRPTVAVRDEISTRKSSGVRSERLRLEREKLFFLLIFVAFFVILTIGLLI